MCRALRTHTGYSVTERYAYCEVEGMNPKRGWLLLIVLFSVGALPCFAAAPRLVWKAKVGGRIYTSAVVCDFLPSPGLETVVCASEERKVICLSATGHVLWSFGEGFSARLTANPAVADLDGDGKPEIVAAGGGSNLVCLSNTGALRWRVKLDGEVDWSAPVIADVDGDGSAEIAVGMSNGFIHCVSAAGAMLWKVKLGGMASHFVAAADVNGDKKKELIAAADRTLFCLDGSGRTIWRFSSPAGCSGAGVGDIDADGALEIVTSCEDQTVYCLNCDGQVKWAYHGGYSGGGHGGFTPSSLCDIDGDGRLEVIFGDGNGAVRCLDAAGKERWYFPTGWHVWAQPTAGDIDGDGEMEVLAGFEDGAIICLDSKGAVRWRFMTTFRVLSSPTLVDIDGDGRAEVIVTSNDNFVYCLRPPGGKRSGRLPWPMQRLDLQQTGAVVGR